MIEGYKHIKQNYLDRPEKMRQCFPDEALRHAIEQIYVFPNIELHLNNFVGKGVHSVNYHVIFSSDVPIQEIEENFLHRLNFNFDASDLRSLTLSNIKTFGKQIKQNNGNTGSDLLVGLTTVSLDYTTILTTLERNSAFLGKYLIAIPVDEDLSEVSWNGRDYPVRKNLYKQSHCLLTSNKKTVQWALAAGHEEAQKNEFGSIKPCIWGSDAHGYERLFKPDNDN